VKRMLSALRGMRGLRGCHVVAAMVLSTPVLVQAASDSCAAEPWPLWQDFQTRFIQPDGRVQDASTPQKHTSSEGQSYGMFFALVADDKTTFDTLWRWTVSNLFAGDAAARLPAWFWGRASDGSWRVLDSNSASDADLWLTYDLLEAGRLWKRPDLSAAGRALLDRIEQEEVAELPGLGEMLLPGAYGFAMPNGTWRLNASYLPLPVLRRLTGEHPNGPWNKMAEKLVRVYDGVSDTGLVADWIGYQREENEGGGHFTVDPVKGDFGSYDAIRTYLWAGMTSPSDPMAAAILKTGRSMLQATARAGEPPETVIVGSGETRGTGGFGFSAALLPALQAIKQNDVMALQRERVTSLLDRARATADAAKTQAPYYQYVLTLFGLGWADDYYRFDRGGKLKLSWEKACQRATAH
jgi:endo-1,4-beta-D-glucanase Y